jgi:exodeoxyribonuclease-3
MMIRVMTYNILDGGLGREKQILEVLQATNPDIVVLQEVFSIEFLDTLAKQLNMKSYFARGNSKRHVALLSRLPIVSCNSYHPFPSIRRALLEAEIECAPNRRFHLLGIHLIALHGLLFELGRWWEIKTIFRHIQPFLNEPCIMLGDFNAIAPNDIVHVNKMPSWLRLIIFLQGGRIYHFALQQILSSGFTDCFRTLHSHDRGFTLPSSKPNARLDYVFVNAPMKTHLHNCFVVREPPSVNEASDHCPMIAEFDL